MRGCNVVAFAMMAMPLLTISSRVEAIVIHSFEFGKRSFAMTGGSERIHREFPGNSHCSLCDTEQLQQRYRPTAIRGIAKKGLTIKRIGIAGITEHLCGTEIGMNIRNRESMKHGEIIKKQLPIFLNHVFQRCIFLLFLTIFVISLCVCPILIRFFPTVTFIFSTHWFVYHF